MAGMKTGSGAISLPPQVAGTAKAGHVNNFEPYVDPLHPVGSIVLIKEPTHDFHYVTKDVIGIVYEAYVHQGFKMYAVIFTRTADCLDMKLMKPSTENLSNELCCQHLDEHRLCPVTIQILLDGSNSKLLGRKHSPGLTDLTYSA